MSAEPLAGKNRIPDIISQDEMILGASNAADANEKIDVSGRRKIVMESGRGVSRERAEARGSN